MNKLKFYFAFLGVVAMFFTACEPKQEPTEPGTGTETKDEIPASFPKKHLIEEFTGQTCGYCPYGMDCIHEFMGNDTNYVLILHHYGYAADHFTVAGSRTITSTLKVSGAPSMTINRAKTNYGEGNTVVFHPGYLPNVNKTQLEQTTYASVNIKNTYDPATRELRVLVSGALCKEDYPELNLTVMVKESGMIDMQSDYYNTFEGWQEFRHANAVRAFLTNAKGDQVTVKENRHYEEQFVIDLEEGWNAENCMVVAFLSEAFQPVVQAAEEPVVEGTKGGADIQHGGITPVAVPDYYPEPSATATPFGYSSNKLENLATATAYYERYPELGLTYWTIQAYNTAATLTIGTKVCIPFAFIYLFTDYADSPSLPVGTYPINGSMKPGSVYAGFRNDETQQIGGSMFYFTGLEYFNQGYLDPAAQWLIASGEMVITEDGWTLIGKARNGAAINLKGTALRNGGSLVASRKIKERL